MRTAKKCKDKSHSYSMQLSRGTKSRIRYLENDLDSQSPVKCKHSQSSTPKIPHQSEAEKNARKKLRNMFIDVVSSTDNMQSSCISDMTTFDTEHGSYQLKTFKTVGIITQIVPITNKQTVPMTNKQTVLMTKKQTVQTNKKQTVLITKKQTVPMTKKQTVPMTKKQTVPMTKKQKRRFRCNFYVASFDQQKLLNAHWVATHGLLACRQSVTCKSVFSNSVNRRIHEKAFYLGRGRWVCDCCGAQFVFISQLLKHNVKHSSVQKYRCKEKHCSKAFKRKAELLDHTKIHKGAQLSCDVDGCEYMKHLKKRLD